MKIWERLQQEYHKDNSAIRQIIIINLSVFILSILVAVFARLMLFDANDVLKYFYLPSDLSTFMWQPWSFLTNIFCHDTGGIRHIFWNLITLYFIGRLLQDFLSTKQVWQIFLYGGLAGSLLYLISYNIFPAFAEAKQLSRLLGASGGVTAIVVATGVHIPRYNVRPFNLFNIEMRWIALIIVLLDLVSFPNSANTGGLLAHIGGAILGALYILHLQGKIELPIFKFAPRSNMKVNRHSKKGTPPLSKKTVQNTRGPAQEEIDAILDKISQSGYDSLTKKEKDLLFKASK